MTRVSHLFSLLSTVLVICPSSLGVLVQVVELDHGSVLRNDGLFPPGEGEESNLGATTT